MRGHVGAEPGATRETGAWVYRGDLLRAMGGRGRVAGGKVFSFGEIS